MSNSITFFALLCMTGLTVACGKNMEKKSDKETEQRRAQDNARIDPVLQHRFEQEQALCDDQACHPSVAKIVVNDQGVLRSCSGALIGEDLVLTSSSCLGVNYRHSGVSCSDHLYTIFPENSAWKGERHFCKQIVFASDVRPWRESALKRQDMAIFRLASPSQRPNVEMSDQGIDQGPVFEVVGYRKKGLISYQESQKCQAVHSSYANPFAQRAQSPMQTLKNCQFYLTGAGSAVFGPDARVAGVMSSGLDTELLKFLEESKKVVDKIGHISHVSNLACYGDGALSSECSKVINVNLLDYYRQQLLYSRQVHQENIDKIVKSAAWPAKYFKWTVNFLRSGSSQGIEATLARPKCFNQLNSWIAQFSRGGRGRTIYTWGKVTLSVPLIRLTTMLDESLRPVSVISDTGETKFMDVVFNPADALFRKASDVSLEGELFGKPYRRKFSSVPSECH